MADTPRHANAGGFVPPTLPSPAPSTASSRAASGLPHPRSKPLVPGSRKEDYARKYAESRLLHISRRYVKKHGIPDPSDTVKGYDNFEELCHDLEEVILVLWFTGTPSIQVPYLLNIALAFTDYIEAFEPAPTATFLLLKKLDHCFASLLQGKDIRTGETLPGFEQGTRKGMTKTDMVRCKSLAEQTRLLIAVVMSNVDEVETYLPEEDEYVPPSRSDPEATPHGEKRKRIMESEPETPAKAEEEEEDDDDEIKEESESSPKRRKTISPDNNKSAAISPLVKLEDGNATPAHSALFSKESLTGMEASKTDGKFHFALEDEDDDDDEDSVNGTGGSSIGETSTAVPAAQARTPPYPIATDEPVDIPPDAYEPDDDEDDDEELHMNVAKVYEKTLVELGRTLGEPIIGY
ncbi:meiotic recombination protein DMC1 [Apiospora arundinis]|uniref:Meiotic recombination protein DMC1 n=1 Tax=Apiospora arundinis TaxID=335852 RepID=A0ABR2I8P8_9PEZI